jgi:ergothioneine biosynthesis protein EgtB
MPDARRAPSQPVDRSRLVEAYRKVRARTEALAAPLSAEDQQLQSQPSSSPTKWHRAHTTWFFETFLLGPRGVPPFDSRYGYLYNSYYEAVGPRFHRPSRGLVSRPSADDVGRYRRAVDGRMIELLGGVDEAALAEIAPLVELGLAHEEQHQELVLTDVLHALSQSPLMPAIRGASPTRPRRSPAPVRFFHEPGGVVEMGHAGAGFAFDNEGPRHRVFLEPFELASRLVTVGEVVEFIEARGYETPSLWLSEGLDFVRRERIGAPLHARVEGGALVVFGVDGEREASPDEPAAFLSYFEADAIARFFGARLPTEAEWEHVASRADPRVGNQLDEDPYAKSLLSPTGCTEPASRGPAQLFGDVWEWTSSSYAPYPGFVAEEGAVGEYNGKFMVSQQVLRGGSCFTPRGHARPTYRNFWHPDTRFQMSGLRLARSVRGGSPS